MIGMEEIINMKIGERGQLMIPKTLREKYGLLPNIEVEFMPEKNGIKLQKKKHYVSPVIQVLGISDGK